MRALSFHPSFQFSRYFPECGAKVKTDSELAATEQKKTNQTILIGVICGIVGLVILGALLGTLLFMKHVKKARDAALMSTWKIDYDELLFDR